MNVVCPPTFREDFSVKNGVFLAGSIEMGKAEPWQDKVAAALADLEGTIYNPRRPDWDSSWVCSIENKQFKQQVHWELAHLLTCEIAVFYFDPKTTSPISMMELGLVLGKHSFDKLIVCCPEGFWKKGNVDVTLGFFDHSYFTERNEALVQVNNLDELIGALRVAIPEVAAEARWLADVQIKGQLPKGPEDSYAEQLRLAGH